MSTSFVKKKRIVNERWESSQIKRNKATFKPAENRDDSESEEELGRTSSRGSKVRKNGIMIVEAKIKDPATNKVLPDGSRGELCIRSVPSSSRTDQNPDVASKSVSRTKPKRTVFLAHLSCPPPISA